MWRFTLPGFMIVGTLLLLLSGGLGLWHATAPDSDVAIHPVVASPASPAPTPPAPVAPQTLQQATAPDPLQVRADALQEQIEHRTQRLASLQAQSDQAQRQLAAAQQNAQSVASSVAEQNKDLASLHDQTQAAQQQLDSLQKQQQAVDAKLRQGNAELASLRTQTEQARQNLAGVQQQQQANGTASAGATQKLAALQEQIGQANRELAKLQQQRQAESASVESLRAQQQRMTASLHSVPAGPPPKAAAPPAPQPAGPTEAQSAAPVAPQPVPAAPAQSQLLSARQELAQGHPWVARRLLSMAQTQLAFQPVTPSQPTAEGGNMAATWVGEAIHWIDAGDTGRAYQAINRAIQGIPGGTPSNVADTAADRSAYPPGYDRRYYQNR